LLITAVTDKAPFDGYTNNPSANSAKLMQSVFTAGDCWFNTGDLVRDQGYRHIGFIDRVGDTFRWKAENVATTEVEAQIQTFADIAEAVVYGVEVPNTDGRAGMASLILAQGKTFNPKAFYQHIKNHLPDYALPLFIRLGDCHEVTGTFKIKKNELKRQGFKPRDGDDAIYVLIDRALGYQPLDHTILNAIEQGQIRF
jgi:acyl-CoA synthetase (AMP-forming)/AMP-acid ligase II